MSIIYKYTTILPQLQYNMVWTDEWRKVSVWGALLPDCDHRSGLAGMQILEQYFDSTLINFYCKNAWKIDSDLVFCSRIFLQPIKLKSLKIFFHGSLNLSQLKIKERSLILFGDLDKFGLKIKISFHFI